MTIVLQRFFEFFVTSIELGLFFYFIGKRLSPSKHFRFGTILFYFFLITSISVMNYCGSSIYLTLLFALFMEILFTFLFTKGTFTEKLFWGGIFRIIDFLAENLTFLIFDIVTHYSTSTLVSEYPMRYITCTVYLILLATFTILLTQLQKNNVALPRWVLFTYVFVIILGIVATETLLDVIIYFDTIKDYSQNGILYRAIWIFLCLFIFLLVLIVYLNQLYQKNIKLLEEQQVQQLEKQQFESIANTIQVLRIWKHDSRQHFSVINELINQQKYEDALTYIQDINDDFESHQFGVFSGNNVLDAIISTKLIPIRENDIPFSHSIYLPEKLPFDNISLSSLMGNLFDNAISSCLQIQDISKRYILLTIKPHQNSLSICMENSSTGKYHYDSDHHLKTTKNFLYHGIGLRRIQEISESVNGFCQIEPEKDKFIVTVVVPLGLHE